MNSVDKIANNTCIFGVMNGLAGRMASLPGITANDATNSLVRSTPPAGLSCAGQRDWMGLNGLLSRNPAGSGGVGRMYPSAHVQCCPPYPPAVPYNTQNNVAGQ